IIEVAEREEKIIVKALVDQELECSTNIVLEEGEENTDKEHGSMGGGPTLIVSFPKGSCSSRRALDIEQRQVMGYINDSRKVLHTWFQNMVPTERILAMRSFEKEGAYPGMKNMLSWAFESHIDGLDFKVCQEPIIIVLESKGVNPLVNAQELLDEQVYNVLNKVMVKIKDKLFTCNDKIRVLEEKLGKREEEL
ncbi:hypothetical protein KI387_031681, partial [Taxus chinensis]